MTQEYHFVTFLNSKAYVVEQYGSVLHSGFQALHFQNLIAWLAVHLEDDARIFSGRRSDFFHIQFLQHLLTAGSLLTLCHIGRESADELLQLLPLLLSLGLLVLSLTQRQLATLVPEAVVAGKHCHLAKIDIYGVGTNAVQEVTVMADHQYRMLKFAQVLLQPLNGVKVQVVSGLIQQQVVGVAKQSLCQHHAYLLLTRELAHQLVMLFFLNAQTREQGCGIAFSCVASHLGKFIFQFSYADAVFVCEVRLSVEAFPFFHYLPHGGVTHQYRIQNGLLIVLEVVLAQHAQAFTRT